MLIDGGLLGSFDAYDLAQAQKAVADLQTSDPFLDLLGVGIPEAAGLFAEVGGLFAEQAPTASATTLQSFPLLPAEFNPAVPVTNSALFGNAFDRDTSPADLGLLHINGGSLGSLGQPARLGRWRAHSDQPPGRDLRAGADQRGRVVLPAATDDRHQRRRPDEAERRRQLPRAAAHAHPPGEPAALRDRDRSRRRPRPRRGPELHPAVEDDAASSRCWSTATR